MAELIKIDELAKRLNRTEREIMNIIEENGGYVNGRILPRIRFADGTYLFPYEEVIEVWPAKKKSPEVEILPASQVLVGINPFEKEETQDLPVQPFLRRGRPKKEVKT